MSQENVNEIVDELRKLTMLTGELASVHQQSLQNWPYIVFEGVENLEIDYDLSKAYFQEVGQNRVDFNLKLSKSQEQMDNRCKCLVSWVRDLFWKEIGVTVTVNNTKVFEDNHVEKKKN